MMEKHGLRIMALVMLSASVCTGLYLISDYFMDNGWPSSFGQSCDKSVEDDCLYIHSHLNSIGIINYDDNIDCMTELNAGTQNGARYKFQFKRFDIEYSANCTADYVEFYGSPMTSISSGNLMGRYCGDTSPYLDVTTQYITVKFHTDGSEGKKGYKIRATRTLPYPCLEDFFHCKAENRCIDARLQCDGTKQCDDGTDEDDCSFFDKLLGTFLALGVSGLVGVGFACILGCTLIGVIICIFTCCRKRCACITKHCCCECCRPDMEGKNKVAPGKTGHRGAPRPTHVNRTNPPPYTNPAPARKPSTWTNPEEPKKAPVEPKKITPEPKPTPTEPPKPMPWNSSINTNPSPQWKEPVQVRSSNEKMPEPYSPRDPNPAPVTTAKKKTKKVEGVSRIKVW